MNGENKMIENLEKCENNSLEKKNIFEERLSKLKNIQEAIELDDDVKEAVKKQEVDENYIKYIRNSIEDKLFCNINFDKISTKVLIEKLCPEIIKRLQDMQNINLDQLNIENVGEHFENQIHYLDKICVYGNSFVCLFGINDQNLDDAIVYEKRKFSREDRIEAVQSKYEIGKKIELEQYDEYYLGIEPDRIKVFSERKMLALAPIEETPFDKIKNRLSKIFNLNMFTHKKKILPHLDLVYDTNPNRWKNFESNSKTDAKIRMKFLLAKEREQVKNEL